MKILATGDWHLGNLFHGNDRLPEHKHFFRWLLDRIQEHSPDAILVSGDVFDNGNPSASAQSAYYDFLADATATCPGMQIIITSGNHDSASRLEAPRPMLSRHNVEIRGELHRTWNKETNAWEIDMDDLMIPLGKEQETIVLAVPYIRSDMVHGTSYSSGVVHFLKDLTRKARQNYPQSNIVMMAHMYAKGAYIADNDASEKIIIGGQEEVCIEEWTNHPDYMTCGHIHKRQHIRNTDWARYSGSILPMSFAETDYRHGVDMVILEKGKRPKVEFLEYTPQHRLHLIPEDDSALSINEIKNRINRELAPRGINGKLSDTFEYVAIKVKLDKPGGDAVSELETLIATKDAVLCKIQKVMPGLGLTTAYGHKSITSVEDILRRDPLETIKETFAVRHETDMSEHQEKMLKELLAEMSSNIQEMCSNN